ncbi:MAG: aspartyl/glutamyl-tRNA amidotransferase subunit A [Clostridia bacterium]|nr:aspartyl/glutamyl-tRNA amidotransferase subunit A [Clostridia bacterium]
MNGIVKLTAAQLSVLLKKRELSSLEITRAYAERIAEANPELNAYVTVTAEKAEKTAVHADENPSEHALAGIPYALKDNFASRGTRMTCASAVLGNFVPDYSCTVAERLEKLSCPMLGKTNMDEFAMGSATERSVFGATKNPLDPTRSAGGSSGGSASAAASYMAPWALGSDTGGSARQPAAFCGAVAMKPTYGVIPRWGLTEFASSLDTVSPITRDVTDSAMVLDAIAGRDRRDMTSVDFSGGCTDALGGEVRGMRIGLAAGFDAFCQPEQGNAVMSAASALGKLGASVEEVTLPDTETVLKTYLIICAAECSSNLARFDGLRYGVHADGDSAAEIMKNTRGAFGDEVKRRILAGTYALLAAGGGDGFRRAKEMQYAICRHADEIWTKFDLILMPTTVGAAFPLGSYENAAEDLYGSDRFTTLANLTGCPAISLPKIAHGLSYGVTLMGKRFAEREIYRAAYALEQEWRSGNE